MKRKTIAILGAGITGLTAAYYLSKDFNVIVLEKENFAGGTASGFKYKDFIFDFGPHKIYTELPGIISEISKICPLIKIKKKNSIYLNNNYFDFPLKLIQIAKKMPLTAMNAGIDIVTKPLSSLPDDSYENFLINRFGKTLYNLSFRDYAFKIWNSNPKELDRELAKRRVAISGIFELIKSVLFKDTKKISAEYFYYPEKGMKQLIDSLILRIQENGSQIITKANIQEIQIKNDSIHSIKFNNKLIKPDYIISTIPLDSLKKIVIGDNIRVFSDDKNLFYQKLNIIYFILNKPRALKDCWIFFPEAKISFQRISEQKAFSPYTCPKDKTAIMVETTKEIDEKLIQEIISQLERVNILKKSEIEEYFLKTLEKAYPVYKKGFSKDLKQIENKIESINNFYLLGRQGLFNYNNVDQCWDMSLKISEQIKANKTKESWQETKRYFERYRIVD